MFGRMRKWRTANSTNVVHGDGSIDPKVQEALLSDPRVKEAMKTSGEQALQNPEVQDAIFKVAKENLTAENAAKVGTACKEWAQDPEVQAKARHYAGMAMEYAGQAGQRIVGCIEQGPDGVRYLTLVASMISFCLAGYNTVNSILSFNVLMAFSTLFQMFFAFTSALFEAKPESIEHFSLTKYQDMLIEYAKFITTSIGRGFFYIYQGILWLVVTHWSWSPLDLGTLVLAVFVLAMGGLHVAMHYGVMPQEVAVKVKEHFDRATGAAGYNKVQLDP